MCSFLLPRLRIPTVSVSGWCQPPPAPKAGAGFAATLPLCPLRKQRSCMKAPFVFQGYWPTPTDNRTTEQPNNNGTTKGTTVLPATTHRSASARPVAAGVWICAAGTLAWLLIAGDLNAAISAAPWLVLLSWFVYASQWRPCLRVDGSGFEVINGLRDHQIRSGP